MSPRWSLALIALCAAVLSTPVQAEAPVEPASSANAVDRARIGDTAGSHVTGRTAVNQAAGSGNAQANLAAIALSADGAGLLGLQSRQSVAIGARDRDASARIDGRAFRASDGLLSINQIAGAGNAQANVIAIGQNTATLAGLGLGQGVTGLGDAALASVAGDAPPDTASAAPLREALITGDALRGSQGVVQVNQTAGVGNRSANAIVLLLPGGTP